MNPAQLRSRSLKRAGELGCPINESLPLPEEMELSRSTQVVVDRILAAYCAAAIAYGFDRSSASAWLEANNASAGASTDERKLILTGNGNHTLFKLQIESMWALCWAIQVVDVLDFSVQCANDFIGRLPDLKKNDSSEAFRESAALRSSNEIVEACDLAYCLHWAVRDAQLRGTTIAGAVAEYVIVQRRHALEWLLCDYEWDEVSLDT